MGEREMPAEQCTNIFLSPFPFLDDGDDDDDNDGGGGSGDSEVTAESIISQAASAIFEMEEVVESLMERRWYVTLESRPSCAGLAPMLSTSVMEFEVRNCLDDAAEQGPRYSDGGRTSETGLCGDLDWRFPIIVSDSRRKTLGKIQPPDGDGGKRKRIVLICTNVITKKWY